VDLAKENSSSWKHIKHITTEATLLLKPNENYLATEHRHSAHHSLKEKISPVLTTESEMDIKLHVSQDDDFPANIPEDESLDAKSASVAVSIQGKPATDGRKATSHPSMSAELVPYKEEDACELPPFNLNSITKSKLSAGKIRDPSDPLHEDSLKK